MVLFGLEIVGGGVMIVIEGDMVVWGLEEGWVVGDKFKLVERFDFKIFWVVLEFCFFRILYI